MKNKLTKIFKDLLQYRKTNLHQAMRGYAAFLVVFSTFALETVLKTTWVQILIIFYILYLLTFDVFPLICMMITIIRENIKK